MAFITKQDLKPFNGITLSAQDYRDLEKITRRKKLKKGIGGYSGNQIRNFVLYEHYCSSEVKEEIINFFGAKQIATTALDPEPDGGY